MRIFILIFGLLAVMASAEEPRGFRLSVPPELVDAGLIDYILPRFGLKTGRRAEVASDGVDVAIVVGGDAPVFARGDRVWSVLVLTNNDAGERFKVWLLSEIGSNTVASFQPVVGERFHAFVQPVVKAEIVFDGDATHGLAVARTHCARCHRVAVGGTGIGIGSTPSFMALRSLPDWAARFEAFYVLNPHPSFMKVDGISPEFDPMRPPSLVPILLTQNEVEAVQAYVSHLAPADLGAAVVAK
jgi:hypothetical protein